MRPTAPYPNLADRAELMAATNPSGWSGVIKVKTPRAPPSVTACSIPTREDPRWNRSPARRGGRRMCALSLQDNLALMPDEGKVIKLKRGLAVAHLSTPPSSTIPEYNETRYARRK